MIFVVAIFSSLVLGENFDVQGYLGAAIIMMGVWISAKSVFSSNNNGCMVTATASGDCSTASCPVD
jgi:drug/metabolite transporter (DMT)-like permease